MSQLIINYSSLNGLSNTAKRVADKYEDRINELEKFRSKIKKLDTSNRGYLDQADYQIRNRINRCEEKRENMQRFYLNVDEFEDRAKQIDKQVANRIKQSTKSFKMKNNIKTGLICKLISYMDEHLFDGFDSYKGLIELMTGQTIEEFKDELRRKGRNLIYNIKDWYYDEGGKYKVDIFIDRAKIVIGTVTIAAVIILAIYATGGTAGAALAAGGGGAAAGGSGAAILSQIATAATAGGISETLAFSSWDILNSAADLTYDQEALAEFERSGNMARADRLESKGLMDLSGDSWGNLMDDFTGNRAAGEVIGKSLVFAGDIASFAGTLQSIEGVGKWDDNASMSKNLVNISGWDKNASTYENLISTANFSEDKIKYFDGLGEGTKKILGSTGLLDENSLNKAKDITKNILTIKEKISNFSLINSGKTVVADGKSIVDTVIN